MRDGLRDKLRTVLTGEEFDELLSFFPWIREVDELRLEQARRAGRQEREAFDKMPKQKTK